MSVISHEEDITQERKEYVRNLLIKDVMLIAVIEYLYLLSIFSEKMIYRIDDIPEK